MFLNASLSLTEIVLWIIYISIPILIIYIAYLILTKAFRYMGFSSFEAIIIVFVSFLFQFNIYILGMNISNIYLFSYNNWDVGINMGGAVIPILLSLYLFFKKKLDWKKLLIGIFIVSVITYLITYPDPSKGIIAKVPLAFAPAIAASIISAIFLYKDFKKAAPFAYISGTIGVLIGADVFHLYELLNHSIDSEISAVIGGANVFDMIFITGIIAVIFDGIILFRQRAKENID